MRLLILDIETAPHLADVWELWGANVSLNQLRASGYILSWAAKWHDERQILFSSINKDGKHEMLAGVHRLLDEADAVITYNGTTFDIPYINGEFVTEGFLPPSPYKHIDIYPVVKKNFRFPSWKLQYVAERFGIGSKVKHEGHELWTRCQAGEPAAWRTMEKYNKHDVTLLEGVYEKVLPWISNHPNMALYIDSKDPACPNCGSKKLQARGTTRTAIQVYQRWQCQGCGKWSRGNKPQVKPVALREIR